MENKKLCKKDGTQFTCLVVDDSVFVIKQMCKLLENMNCKVLGRAINGEEALAMYEKLRPDFVTLDITMPKKDGIETLTDIIKADPSAKVIMVTALGQKAMVKKAVELGATYFIVKPLNQEKLEQTLVPVLKKLG